MLKRMIALVVWLYVTWVAWNFVAYMTGLSTLPGPLIAAVLSALIAADPTHRIWPRTHEPSSRIRKRLAAIRPEA